MRSARTLFRTVFPHKCVQATLQPKDAVPETREADRPINRYYLNIFTVLYVINTDLDVRLRV
jgi:hypothetical protein